MSADLQTQLIEYGRYHRAAQHPIDMAELLSRGALPAPLQLAPAPPPPSRRPRWAWAAVAAVVIGLLIGGIALLRRAPDEEVIDQTTTTSLPAPVPPALGDVLEPGSWSIAAAFTQPPPSDQLASSVAEVQTWPGVLAVAAVDDPAAWLSLTGLDAGDCTAEMVVPPCGRGLVALVAASQIPVTSLRLETEFAMTPITASDVPGPFIDGYLTAAEAQTGFTDLQFDPAALGAEQPLRGPLSDVTGEECDECEIVVQTEVNGFVFVSGLDFDGDPQVGLIYEVSGGGGTGVGVEDLSIDGTGRGGAIANLQAQVGGRAVYGFAFLPLDSAVVTFDLADGTSVWQRPISGMALFVDGPDTASAEDGYPRITDRFVVLDAAGSEIMHVRGTPDGAEFTDLRIDPALAGATQTDPGVVPPKEVADTTLTWTQTRWPNVRPRVASPTGFLGTGPGGRLWRSIDGASWELDTSVAGVEQISLVDAGTHLLLSGVESDGTMVLSRSADGAVWTPIDGAGDMDVEIVAATPTGLTWFRGRRDGGVLALIEGDRIVESYSPPWDTGNCCIQIDLLEFETGVVALASDRNEPKFSVAYHYEGAGVWSEAVSVPISSSHPQVGGRALMFDHAKATCCDNPISGPSAWPLLESTNGLDWTEIDNKSAEDVSSLQIRAGDSFWLYGPNLRGGGPGIETEPSRPLWISRNGRDWDPIDISFAAPGVAEVLGNSLFLLDETGSAWIGTLQNQ